MSYLTYTVGGASSGLPPITVALALVNTQGITRRPVFSEDGQDYLYTHWTFDVLAVLNRFATSQSGPVVQPGFSPSLTEQTLRDVLMRPRGRLQFIADDGGEVLECPLHDRAVDATGGPKPLHFDIVRIAGSESIHVRWVVTCDVVDCDSRPLILSHRWEMSEADNEDFLPSRTVDGIVVFDLGELAARNIDPDLLRGIFPHPVPFNFKRRSVQVWPSSDGTTLRYQIVDDMLPRRWGPLAPVTRIEATHTEQVAVPNVPGQIQSGMAGMFGGSGGPMGWFWRNGTLPGLVGLGLRWSQKLSPQAFTHLLIRCWGGPNTTRRDLERWAIGIAAGRVGGFGLLTMPGVDMLLTHDLASSFVEFRATLQHAPGIQTFARLAAISMDRLGTSTAVSEEISTINRQLAFTRTRQPGVGLPHENGTRTVWLGDIVSQFLKQGCVAPVDAQNYVRQVEGLTPAVIAQLKGNAFRQAPNVRGGVPIEVPNTSQNASDQAQGLVSSRRRF